MSDLVVVGRIRRAHGVKGVVVVEPTTADADAVFVPGRELHAGTRSGAPAEPPRSLRIEMAEPFQGGYRLQLSGIDGRDEADRWRDRCLLAPRAELPDPVTGEIYLRDVVGFRVEDSSGSPVGVIEAYYELPHDVMIEVARPAGAVLVPWRFVTAVQPAEKRIVVQPPEGLL